MDGTTRGTAKVPPESTDGTRASGDRTPECDSRGDGVGGMQVVRRKTAPGVADRPSRVGELDPDDCSGPMTVTDDRTTLNG
ncbi:hypothetical protein [Halosolutus halophilus]|uniref:hypothetical protein n=1 Tax=Halosolutus halophilus TaxID=1552990 RepID=UPI0022351AFB|nr:hypothetical protein [Halosolutus halophilus]